MGDNYYASISIPGRLINEEVLKMINYEGLEVECDGETDDVSTFYDACAHNGDFSDLEDLLVELKIPFDRYSDHYCEYSACIRHYRPADNEESETDITVMEDVDGYRYVVVDDLKPLLKMEPFKAILELKELISQADPEVVPLKDYCKGVEQNGA